MLWYQRAEWRARSWRGNRPVGELERDARVGPGHRIGDAEFPEAEVSCLVILDVRIHVRSLTSTCSAARSKVIPSAKTYTALAHKCP